MRDVTVSRVFMSQTYGGSSQCTFPKISDKMKRKGNHTYDDFMYLPDDYQPEAPQIPGAPGLWLNVSSESAGTWYKGQVMRLFTRIAITPVALWLYQGQYELKPVKSLTKEEWAAQTTVVCIYAVSSNPNHSHADKWPKVRRKWASEICRKDWGIRTLINIYHRKHYGGKMTKEDFEQIVNNRDYRKVTEEQVQLALTSGEEVSTPAGTWAG